MAVYRENLPQIEGGLFLTDAGLETDLIFNHGIEIREFAAHTLLETPAGRFALAQYFRAFLALADRHNVGFIFDSPTWRAHTHWSAALGANAAELAEINREAINFIAELRDEFAGNRGPIVLNAVIGPCGDAYAPEAIISADAAACHHAQQIGWLAQTEVDMVSALTFTQSSEAVGIVRAANDVGLPIVVSFTVETDGTLPTGQPIGEAISEVDAATDRGAAYFMINCAHPDHFRDALHDEQWLRRVRGLRCNASRCSHAELDEAETLDAGDPVEFSQLYRELTKAMPWVNVLGGCCGSDLRHVTAIADSVISGAAADFAAVSNV
jgi:homocysteine S-methyltransferase